MDGLNIKMISIIAMIFILSSCKKDIKSDKTINQITDEYIIDFQNTEEKRDNNFVLHIKKDSSNVNYDVHRISMWINAIDTTYLPNEIEQRNNVVVAFYTKRIAKKEESTNIVEILKKNNFFKKDSFLYNSNYPEWIILKNKKTGKQTIVKDMWYYPLDSVIKRYKNQID